VVAVVAVSGCDDDDAPDRSCDVAVPGFRRLMQNGTSSNGTDAPTRLSRYRLP